MKYNYVLVKHTLGMKAYPYRSAAIFSLCDQKKQMLGRSGLSTLPICKTVSKISGGMNWLYEIMLFICNTAVNVNKYCQQQFVHVCYNSLLLLLKIHILSTYSLQQSVLAGW